MSDSIVNIPNLMSQNGAYVVANITDKNGSAAAAGANLSNLSAADFSGVAPATYFFTGTAEPGSSCEREIEFGVIVKETGILVVSGDQTICHGDDVTLSANAQGKTDGQAKIGAFNWDNGAHTASNVSNDSYTLNGLTADKTVNVTFNPSNGCGDEKQIQITVLPQVSAGDDDTIEFCEGTEGSEAVDLNTLFANSIEPAGSSSAFKGGSGAAVNQIQNFTALAVGSYTFKKVVTYSQNGTTCTDEAILTVNVTAAPNYADGDTFEICN